jgi:hypothetical protein
MKGKGKYFEEKTKRGRADISLKSFDLFTIV